MPYKPSGPCGYPRCPNLATNHGYCDQHKKQEQKTIDSKRNTSNERGYNYNWRKVRLIKLSLNPLCEECEKNGLVTPANEVHHVDGNPTHNDINNLMSLCHSCHSSITSKMQGFASNPIPPSKI